MAWIRGSFLPLNDRLLESSFSIEEYNPRFDSASPLTLGHSLNLYVQVVALKIEDVDIDLKIQGITY